MNRVAGRLPYPVAADIDLDTGPAAELLARRLVNGNPAVASGEARTVVALLWRPLAAAGAAFTVPAAWQAGRRGLSAPTVRS